MSTKRASYSSEFKVKVVLELLANELTLAELASKHNITTKNIQNWRKQFLENVESVFDKEQLVREYKSELSSKNDQVDELYRQIGKLTAQV